MDIKEQNTQKHIRSNKFDERTTEKAQKQLEMEGKKPTRDNLRKKIKSLEDVHRRDKSGNKNLSNFQGNADKYNNWGNERAINKVLRRKQKQEIVKDI